MGKWKGRVTILLPTIKTKYANDLDLFNKFILNFLNYLAAKKEQDFDKEDYKTYFCGQGVDWFLDYSTVSKCIDDLLQLSQADRLLIYETFKEDINYVENIDKVDFEFNYPILPPSLRDVVKPFFESLYDNILGGSTGIRINGMSIDKLKRDEVRKGFFESNRKEDGNINSVCPACLEKISVTTEDGHADLDHYLTKSIYPMLAVSAENLIPLCKPCNQIVKKNVNPLKDNLGKGGILNIFLPYHRPGIDFIKIDIMSIGPHEKVLLHAKNGLEENNDRIKNFEELFDLSTRWYGTLKSSLEETIRVAVLTGVRYSNEPFSEDLVRTELKKIHETSLCLYKTVDNMFLQAEYTRILINDKDRFTGFFNQIQEQVNK
jgi:hypothetical protein